ncbi:helicase associated domain-containing protein [Streptomyces albus]|uniref:helicase associated domain-containing protein n=1 Tax=Streptomyces albus TaxID=1888 RepID=UPI0030B8C505
MTWRRTYAAAKAHVEAGGSVDLPGDWRTGDGVPLGQWLNRQRNRWRQLDPAQAQLLLELGATPDVDSLYPGPFVTPERQEFRRGLIAAAAYLAREGNLLVPRAHVEETWIGPVRLGAFILKHRRWPQKLTPQERSALEAMRMVWDVRLARAAVAARPPHERACRPRATGRSDRLTGHRVMLRPRWSESSSSSVMRSVLVSMAAARPGR